MSGPRRRRDERACVRAAVGTPARTTARKVGLGRWGAETGAGKRVRAGPASSVAIIIQNCKNKNIAWPAGLSTKATET